VTRDQYITENILHKCWHDWLQTSACSIEWQCSKCGVTFFGSRNEYVSPETNPDFSASHAYELQQFVLRAEWWAPFWKSVWLERAVDATGRDVIDDYEIIAWLFSDASRFADLVAEFRGWKE
jgi:hypothetical protein